jgi:hypothetical protein
MRRAYLLLGACAWLAACAPREAALAATWQAAVQEASARDALIAVHFRLPGRPLSDAMDATFTAADLHALAPACVHVRLEAADAPELFARLCGGSTRRGAGLATCITDGAGSTLACALGCLSRDGVRALLADASRLHGELRVHGATASPARTLALAAHCARLGRIDLARARAQEVFAGAEPPWRAQAAAQLARWAVESGDLVAARHWLAVCDENAGGVALTRALLHAAARQPWQALSTLRELATRRGDPDRATVLLCLGRCQHDTGDDQGALATFALLCREFPDHALAAHAACAARHVRSGEHGHRHEALPP